MWITTYEFYFTFEIINISVYLFTKKKRFSEFKIFFALTIKYTIDYRKM